MRILAVDYGRKRTGLALGDDEVRVAAPLETVACQRLDVLVEAVARVAQREGVGLILVGFPLNMDGSEGPMARSARRLARALEERTGLPVELIDERLTTHAAERKLAEAGFSRGQRAHRVDALAAALLLKTYLDRLPR